MTTTAQRTPLEQLMATATSRRSLTVGVPAVTGSGRRFPLTPEGAAMLVSRGMDVRVQKGAGAAIHYADNRYLRAGARIVSRAEALASDIVLSLEPLGAADAAGLRRGSLLMTLLCPLLQDPAGIRVLLDRHVVTIALDLINTPDAKAPFADILNEIEGRAAMAAAASLLADPDHGKGILLGGVAGIIPCEVTVIGAGIGGMAAARTATGMGAMVRMFDTDIYALRAAARDLGSGVVASAMHPHVLVNALRTADVVIASQTTERHSLDSDVVAEMKRGVVTIQLETYGSPEVSALFRSMPVADLADTGGESLRSLDGDLPRVCCVNAAGTVPRTVAMALSNTLYSLFGQIVDCGGGTWNTLKLHGGIQRAVCTFLGRPVNTTLAAAVGLHAVDINLLLQFS